MGTENIDERQNGIHEFLGSYKGSMSLRRVITRRELDFYLYGRTDVKPVKLEEGSPGEEKEKQQNIARKIPNYAETSVDILQLRYKLGVEKEFRSYEEFSKVLTAIKCIPPQLHLCYSSIPAAGFGICAVEMIPEGTWLGPYEGKRLSIEEIQSMMDTRYVWEIYKNGVLDHGVNGIELEYSSSSWMKYIQCARNITEQNTVAFQFGADIYFRTYKMIRPGEELLVWYAEYYEQYHGVPIGVRKLTKETSQPVTKTTEVTRKVQSMTEAPPPMANSIKEPQPVSQRKLYTMSKNRPPSLTSNRAINRAPEAHFVTPLTAETQPQKSLSPEFKISPPAQYENPHVSQQLLKQEQNNVSPKPNATSTTLVDMTMPPQKKVTLKNNIGLAVHTLKTRFWKCDHCLSKFPQKWALQVHSCPCEVARPYKCSNCGKAYVNKDEVQAHAEQCGGGRQYKCGYCRRSFMNVNILSKHLRVHSRQTVATGAFKRKTRKPIYQRLVQ